MSNELLARFRKEAERDRLADCSLFLGPSRRALRELARDCAVILLDARGELSEHPDAVVFDPEELGVRGLQVAHVAEREGAGESVEAALRYKPLRGGRRALLLFEVDRMTADAQAALLKTSEEPPPATHFLLTAADPTPILPALLSRCRIARVATPPQDELLRRAAAIGLEGQEFLILSQAMGRAEAALDLDSDARSNLFAAHRDFQDWLSEPGIAPHWAAPRDGSLAEQRENARLSLSSCLGWLVAVYASSGTEQALRLDRLAELLTTALAEIGNQITPSLVLEQLAEQVRETVAPR
jgi:DNA polymerase III, delta subunit